MLDQHIQQLLTKIGNEMERLQHPSLSELTAEQSRYYYAIARTFFEMPSVTGVNREDKNIKGHLPIRVYRPNEEGTFPVFVYFHGGGWVFGDIESADFICAYIARYARCTVVSVGYRLAPEHKYPAALEDAVRAIRWSYENLKGSRFVIGGESSGGNLAAAAALRLKDEPIEIALQFLITPVVDRNFERDSYAYPYNLTKEKMIWFWQQYLAREEQGNDPYAAPLLAKDFENVAPAFIVTAQYDPLRDEGAAYANTLQQHGIPVTYLQFDRIVHSFINMIGVSSYAKQCMEQMVEQFRFLIYDET